MKLTRFFISGALSASLAAATTASAQRRIEPPPAQRPAEQEAARAALETIAPEAVAGDEDALEDLELEEPVE